jgi:hypothetical protein
MLNICGSIAERKKLNEERTKVWELATLPNNCIPICLMQHAQCKL